MASSIEKIRKDIYYSINNKTVLTIAFKNVNISHKFPQLVSCEGLKGTRLRLRGIFPLKFYGENFVFDLKDVLGCKTYAVKKDEFISSN